MKRLILVAACAFALAACSNPDAERQAQQAAAAAAKAQQEEKAEGVAKQYDMAVAAQDWERAHPRRLAAGSVQGHRRGCPDRTGLRRGQDQG